MKRSPFLGEMDDSFLNELAKKPILKSYPAQTKIYKQEHISKGIYILIDGELSIYRSQAGVSKQLRTISTPGFIVGWEGLLKENNLASAETVVTTKMLYIPIMKSKS